MIFDAIKTVVKQGCSWVAKHSPEILTFVGASGAVTSVVLAVKATPRAAEKIEEKKKELNKDKLTTKETVQACWKEYVPTAVVTMSTVGCILGAHFIHTGRQAALASLCSIAEQGMLAKEKEIAALKEEMTKAVGEEKAKEIQSKVEEKVEKARDYPVNVRSNQLFLWNFMGQFFYATPNEIFRKEHKLNRKLLGGMELYMSKNEIFDEFGLDHDRVDGDRLYVTIDDKLEFRVGEAHINDGGELYIDLIMETYPHEL